VGLCLSFFANYPSFYLPRRREKIEGNVRISTACKRYQEVASLNFRSRGEAKSTKQEQKTAGIFGKTLKGGSEPSQAGTREESRARSQGG